MHQAFIQLFQIYIRKLEATRLIHKLLQVNLDLMLISIKKKINGNLLVILKHLTKIMRRHHLHQPLRNLLKKRKRQNLFSLKQDLMLFALLVLLVHQQISHAVVPDLKMYHQASLKLIVLQQIVFYLQFLIKISKTKLPIPKPQWNKRKLFQLLTCLKDLYLLNKMIKKLIEPNSKEQTRQLKMSLLLKPL